MASSHHVSTALGFGASAVMPLSVIARAQDKHGSAEEQDAAIRKFVKACEKALIETMGKKIGLCTAEVPSGGEFFEPNFFDTNSGKLAEFFPNMNSPVGGVSFETRRSSPSPTGTSHALGETTSDILMLGLFKERSEARATAMVWRRCGFVDMTEEAIRFKGKADNRGKAKLDIDRAGRHIPLNTLRLLEDAHAIDEAPTSTPASTCAAPNRSTAT